MDLGALKPIVNKRKTQLNDEARYTFTKENFSEIAFAIIVELGAMNLFKNYYELKGHFITWKNYILMELWRKKKLQNMLKIVLRKLLIQFRRLLDACKILQVESITKTFGEHNVANVFECGKATVLVMPCLIPEEAMESEVTEISL